jgi:hypothetical protein
LPVPTSLFVAGAGLVVVLSFIALALLWPKPRLQEGLRARQLIGARLLTTPFRVLGVVCLGLVVTAGAVAALAGTDVAGSRNLGPVLLWVGFWLVVPFMGAVVGNLYTLLNPWRALAGWLGVGGTERPEMLARLGVMPAVGVLMAFTWMELVWPDAASPGSIATAAVVYTVGLIALAAMWGRETTVAVADAFTPYNRLLSSIAPLGRSAEGRLVWRGWLRSLPQIPEWRGLWVFVVAMIGTVSFDGLSSTAWYGNALGSFGSSIAGGSIGLIGMTMLVGAGYRLACAVAARLGGAGDGAWVAARFAHTLVPIALAYAVAHYFTLVIFEGQQLWSAISDPFGVGWDLFGTRGYKINFFLQPIAIWYVQVGAIVSGHVAGVVLAHDRALADFPGVRAVRSQYAMLLLMVLLTGLGLVILAG